MKVCIIGDGLVSLALAKVRAVKPEPIIQTLILFLILTTKIRWYKVIKLIHKYEYKKNSQFIC